MTVTPDFYGGGTAIPNEGTKESPVELTVGTSHQGTVNGSIGPFESYYKYELEEAANVTISVSDMSIEQNIKIKYHGSNFLFESVIQEYNETSIGGETAVIGPLFAGTYYFGIYDLGQKGVKYQVTVNGTEISNEGTKENPVELTVDSYYKGFVNGSKNPCESYYKFKLQYETDIKILIENVPALLTDQDIKIKYCDSDPLFSSCTEYDKFTILGISADIGVLSPGTYYFGIHNYDPGTVIYDVIVYY